MKNNGIKLKTWENFSKLKQEIETMLDKKINNDYLLNLLIIEGKMITFGKTIEYKIEKVVIPLDTLEDEKLSNSDTQCEVSIPENKKEEKP
ncbi:hypothetical protein KAW18_01765 [candidate division WOR-3 bacterium]|nr:hypothetical protein [candidate division WOR-3 bacterium]